jgi:hypothetical protein
MRDGWAECRILGISWERWIGFRREREEVMDLESCPQLHLL